MAGFSLSSTQKSILIDIVVLSVVSGVAAVFVAKVDAFETWYEYTRAHEDWELDELTGVVFALLLGWVALSIRHIFILRHIVKRLKDTQAKLEASKQKEIRTEKLSALGELATGLAHEINNALMPIVGLSGLIKEEMEETGNTKHYEFMKNIEAGGLHARDIVLNVLEFSGQNITEPEKLKARESLLNAISFARSMLPTSIIFEIKGLDEDDQSIPDSTLIYAHTSNLSQIFMNLFNNARDALQEQGQISVSAEMDPKQDFIIISVADTGEGMDQSQLDKIFDPFFSTKDVSEGTGLGTSIVYGIMQKLGGDVSVESTLGEGTCFTLRFPVFSSDPKKEN